MFEGQKPGDSRRCMPPQAVLDCRSCGLLWSECPTRLTKRALQLGASTRRVPQNSNQSRSVELSSLHFSASLHCLSSYGHSRSCTERLQDCLGAWLHMRLQQLPHSARLRLHTHSSQGMQTQARSIQGHAQALGAVRAV